MSRRGGGGRLLRRRLCVGDSYIVDPVNPCCLGAALGSVRFRTRLFTARPLCTPAPSGTRTPASFTLDASRVASLETSVGRGSKWCPPSCTCCTQRESDAALARCGRDAGGDDRQAAPPPRVALQPPLVCTWSPVFGPDLHWARRAQALRPTWSDR